MPLGSSTPPPYESDDGGRAAPRARTRPLYRQVRHLLLESLRRGEWMPGTAIPSETELAVRFQVSQGTVRKAIDELASENLLVRRQGKGTFVATTRSRVPSIAFCGCSRTTARRRRPAAAFWNVVRSVPARSWPTASGFVPERL